MKMKSYLLKFDEETHKRIKKAAIENDMSMQDFIVGAIKVELERDNEKVAKEAV